MTHGVRLVVSGRHACFTRPEMKVERVSYDVMTPSAARGILEAIHWKPAIRWIVESIHALNADPLPVDPPQRGVGEGLRRQCQGGDESRRRRRPLLTIEHARQQRAAQVLCDVAYVICARFEMTGQGRRRGQPGKASRHVQPARARAGQCFHQPCLGTREFPADFRLIEPGEPMPPAIERSIATSA